MALAYKPSSCHLYITLIRDIWESIFIAPPKSLIIILWRMWLIDISNIQISCVCIVSISPPQALLPHKQYPQPGHCFHTVQLSWLVACWSPSVLPGPGHSTRDMWVSICFGKVTQSPHQCMFMFLNPCWVYPWQSIYNSVIAVTVPL